MSDRFWTTAKEDQLRSLFAAGLPGSAIAAELGCTRNTVIGKVHRLGLSRALMSGKGAILHPQEPVPADYDALKAEVERLRLEVRNATNDITTSKKKTRQIAMAPPPAIELPAAPLPEITEPEPEGWRERRVSLIDAGSTHCRWPAADDGGASMVCGAPKPRKGTSYCLRHDRISRGSHA